MPENIDAFIYFEKIIRIGKLKACKKCRDSDHHNK